MGVGEMSENYSENIDTKNRLVLCESDKDKMFDILSDIKRLAMDLYNDRGEDELTSKLCQEIINLADW